MEATVKIHANVWNHCEVRKVRLPHSLAISQSTTDLCPRCALGLSEVTGQILWEFHSSVHPKGHKSTWFLGELEAMYFEMFLQ